MSASDIIRVAVFDDHPLMRQGIVQELLSHADFAVVAEGSSAAEAVRATLATAPDVVLLDLSMPGGGLDALKRLLAERPDSRIVIVSMATSETDVRSALSLGARGYVHKDVGGLELAAAIRAVHAGEPYVSPGLAALLLVQDRSTPAAAAATPGTAPLAAGMTARENQILDLVAKGLSNKEIGRKMDLSEKTVRQYLTRVLQKLKVRNRVEAAMLVAGLQPERARRGS